MKTMPKRKGKKDYHKSRKFMIFIFVFFFMYSIWSFNLRAHQRQRNLKIVEQMHDNEKAFKLVNDMSRNEDTTLVIVAHLILISVFIIVDRKHLFEK